ncbi:MAG: hypothetical protein ACXW2E_00625 [Nitrososphaeraceae archaeon]
MHIMRRVLELARKELSNYKSICKADSVAVEEDIELESIRGYQEFMTGVKVKPHSLVVGVDGRVVIEWRDLYSSEYVKVIFNNDHTFDYVIRYTKCTINTTEDATITISRSGYKDCKRGNCERFIADLIILNLNELVYY